MMIKILKHKNCFQVGSPLMYIQQGGPGPTNHPGFNQGTNMLQGPLAYLEKTTSNIGKLYKTLPNIHSFIHSFGGVFSWGVYFGPASWYRRGIGRSKPCPPIDTLPCPWLYPAATKPLGRTGE